MIPAKALGYWWSSMGAYHSFAECNLRVGTRPERSRRKNVMTIYDATPRWFRSVETKAIKHPSCIVSVRDDTYEDGWNRLDQFLNQIQLIETYQQTVDEGSFLLGHGTVRMGPVHAGHIREENLELFTATVSFQFGFNQNAF